MKSLHKLIGTARQKIGWEMLSKFRQTIYRPRRTGNEISDVIAYDAYEAELKSKANW